MNNIIQFPTSKRMPRSVAERKFGNIVEFRYHAGGIELNNWTRDFLVGRYVLIGFGAINTGLIDCFKNDYRCHEIVKVIDVDINMKPCIEVCCRKDKFQIYNWYVLDEDDLSNRAILLTIDQANYFLKCNQCLNREDVEY